jgi:hypothetical protein
MKHAVRVMLLVLFTLVMVRSSYAQAAVTVSFGPPALPVYEQPVCPGEGYLWGSRYMGLSPRAHAPLDSRLVGLEWKWVRLP